MGGRGRKEGYGKVGGKGSKRGRDAEEDGWGEDERGSGVGIGRNSKGR